MRPETLIRLTPSLNGTTKVVLADGDDSGRAYYLQWSLDGRRWIPCTGVNFVSPRSYTGTGLEFAFGDTNSVVQINGLFFRAAITNTPPY